MMHVVLALQDKTGDYSRHAGVTMQSVLENTKEQVCFHLFHDETLSDKNKERFETLCADSGHLMRFHAISLPLAEGTLNAIKYLSMGTLYRLAIADQLEGIDRAIYLDSDIVVTLDLADLYAMDVSDYSIAAVFDKGVQRNPRLYNRYFPVDLKKYFNAGVILFNLAEIRKRHDLFRECMELLQRYPKDPFTDQSALNAVLQDECKMVDDRYNFVPNEDSELSEKKVWHFAGGYKPWEARVYAVDQLYWQYLQKTPWGKDSQELFKYYAQTVVPLDIALLTHPTGSKRKFFHSVCVRAFREILAVKDKFFS